MKTHVRGLFAAVAATLLASCLGTGKPRPASIRDDTFVPDTSGRVVYMQPVPTSRRSVVAKTYDVGAQRVATVGEPVIGVQRYTARDRVVAAITLRPFRQLCRWPREDDEDPDVEKLACRSGRLSLVRGEPRDRFEVGGAFTEAGKTYYFVRVPAKGGGLYLVVDARGRLRPGKYLAWASERTKATPAGLPLRWLDVPVPLEEKRPLFRYETEESVSHIGGGFQHWELLYRGVTSDARGTFYHLAYREYRRDNPSLPLYEQDLPFSTSTPMIEVLGRRIQVHDASPTQIVYTVVEE